MDLQLERDGWLRPGSGIRVIPSPHVDTRPPDVHISLLVVHNISLPPGEFGGPWVAQLFTGQLDDSAHPWFEQLRGLRVCAHFFIRRDGAIIQFASTLARAWHAGISSFQGRTHCNDFSIGVELEGTDNLPYADVQYNRLIALTHVLRKHHPLEAVCGHQHIAPGRKTDPGPAFDWERYAHGAGWDAHQYPAAPSPGWCKTFPAR